MERQRQGFGVAFTVTGIAPKGSLLPKEKGAVVMVEDGVVCCPRGGRTNCVLLPCRSAPSAVARRASDCPEPPGAAGGGGAAPAAALCCHGGASPQLPVVPQWEPPGAAEEKKAPGKVFWGQYRSSGC